MNQLLLFVALSAVKRHVLDKMGDAELIIIFKQGAHLNDEA